MEREMEHEAVSVANRKRPRASESYSGPDSPTLGPSASDRREPPRRVHSGSPSLGGCGGDAAAGPTLGGPSWPPNGSNSSRPPPRSAKEKDRLTSHVATEQRRRDRINESIVRLRGLIPHAERTDKASFLSEVIDYVRGLQAACILLGGTPMEGLIESTTFGALYTEGKLEEALAPMRKSMAALPSPATCPPPSGSGGAARVDAAPVAAPPMASFVGTWDSMREGQLGALQTTLARVGLDIRDADVCVQVQLRPAQAELLRQVAGQLAT